MNNISIRQGETFEVGIRADDSSAVSVRFQVAKDDVIHIDETATFLEKKASIRTNETDLPLGEYEYMITVVYSDGFIEMLPDPEKCAQGIEELPKFTVSKSISQDVA